MQSECGKIYINDKGTQVILDCGSDVSSALEMKILWKNPEGLEGEWIATIENNRYIKYTNPNEWGVSGVWRFMAYIKFATGYTFHGETALYEIFPKFE